MFLVNNASEFRCVVMGGLFVEEDSEFHPRGESDREMCFTLLFSQHVNIVLSHLSIPIFVINN